MKVSQLRSAINEYREIMNECGNRNAANGLRKFDEIFEGTDKMTIAAFAKKVQSGRAILGKEPKK